MVTGDERVKLAALKAAYDDNKARAVENAAEVADLKSAVSEVVDETEVEKTRTASAAWADGILQVNGSVATTTSYIYSNKISVNSGDLVYLRKGDGAIVSKATRLCAYNGDTPVPGSGKSDDFNLPYAVPDGISYVAATISAAYRSENCYYEIKYTDTEKTPKVYLKTETYNKEEVDELIADAGTVKSVNNILPDGNGNITIEAGTKLVTQIEETTTVQRQVVESQIDVVDSARNAANHGVLPSNDGTTNYNNLQSLINGGGTIVIDVPGIYEINGMLLIGSDTELIFGKQVYMKQMNGTGGFIVNVGAATNTYNENIRIYGLNIICNGKNGDSATYRTGLRGKIAFGFVRNLILDSIYVNDIPNGTYFIHVAAYDNVLIQNCHIEGEKDGIHSSCGDHLTIRNCYFRTADDPIALNCQDYPSSIPYYGWIKNVLIENCIDDSPAGTGGAKRARTILLYGGAWTDWSSGNYYRNGDTVVSTNGKVYRLLSQTAISDETVVQSTVAPSTDSGIQTTSDGLTWKFIQDETIYNVACENVTIRNLFIICPRIEPIRFHNDNSQYTRSIYPGVYMPSHKNIVLENISIVSPCDYFVGAHEPVDIIKVVNSKLLATYMFRIAGSYSVGPNNAVTNIVFVGNEIFRDGGSTVFILTGKDGKTINAKTYGNYSNGKVSNSVSQAIVNMLANDLF